jgi:hypothetical protein
MLQDFSHLLTSFFFLFEHSSSHGIVRQIDKALIHLSLEEVAVLVGHKS